MGDRNIFVALYSFGPGSEENYLTESLVFVLRLLLEREPQVGLALMRQLLNVPEDCLPREAHSLNLTTRVTIPEGIPDVEIRSENFLGYIEVKHDAPLAWRQLEKYADHLQGLGVQHTRLVLLSRSKSSAQAVTLHPTQYHNLCWYQVHDWLKQLSVSVSDAVCLYFIHNLAQFLESKNMSLPKVGPEYIAGVSALLHLTNMLRVAIDEVAPTSVNQTNGQNWRGYFLNGGNLFCGVRFDNPHLLVFENNGGAKPSFKQTLDLAQTDFFSVDNNEQLERIIKFVRMAYQQAPAPKAPMITGTPPPVTDDEQ